MTISLYDATARSFIQTLGGLSGVMAKGLAHAEGAGIDLVELVEVRLAPDMLPLRYQIQSACQHSLGGLQGTAAGEFIPGKPQEATYASLQALLAETIEALKAWTPEQVNALAGGDVVFKFGEREMPFEAADFLLSFSVPNFFFHATTAYDILRSQGVPLSKGDFLGRIRLKR